MPEAAVVRYMEARKTFFENLEKTKSRLDVLLESMLDHTPTLQQLAQLEGLHAEKRRLFTDFVATEDRFVNELLTRRSSAS